MERVPAEIAGWWRIIETSQWADEYLDQLPSTISRYSFDLIGADQFLEAVGSRVEFRNS